LLSIEVADVSISSGVTHERRVAFTDWVVH
jgi:hypothetical protein